MSDEQFSSDPRTCLAEMISGCVYAIVSEGATAESVREAPSQMWLTYADLFTRTMEARGIRLVKVQ